MTRSPADDHGPAGVEALRPDPLGGLLVDAPAGFADALFVQWIEVPSPLGPALVAFTDEGICYLRPAPVARVAGGPIASLEDLHDRFGRPLRAASRPPAGLATALRTGRSRSLRFDLRGLSEFERAVLDKTGEIPRGQVRPYSWVAAEIGRPRAVRAVGSAVGRNPIPLLIPCHRVIRRDGAIGDYLFGSPAKHELLTQEGVDLDHLRALAIGGVHFIGSDTTRIVCFPTCHHARRIRPSHRIDFRSVQQASLAGYRQCLDCRPATTATAP